jgi:virulence-associated protein VagC
MPPRREGNRLILEPIEEWAEDFRACLGAWSEEIERPIQTTLDELRHRGVMNTARALGSVR